MISSTKIDPILIEVEQTMLGRTLKPKYEFEKIDTLAETAETHDFELDKHKIIYSAMLAIMFEGEHLDVQSLRAKLVELNQLDTVGGCPYLYKLIERSIY